MPHIIAILRLKAIFIFNIHRNWRHKNARYVRAHLLFAQSRPQSPCYRGLWGRDWPRAAFQQRTHFYLWCSPLDTLLLGYASTSISLVHASRCFVGLCLSDDLRIVVILSCKMVFDVSNKDFPSIPGRGTSLKTWQKSKFEKQREEEVLRNAHERGYLRASTANDIFDSIGEKCDLEDISFLNMSRICLHTVQTIDLCTRLRICVLHSNYISSFDSLSFCRDLVYLDLHNNQVFLISSKSFISFFLSYFVLIVIC